MATGDAIPFQLTSATFGTDINKARRGTIRVSTVVGEDPGPASAVGGPATVVVQRARIDVEVYTLDPSAARALVGAAAANLVFNHKGDGGSNEKETVKSVLFHTFLGPFDIRDADDGGPIRAWGVAGTAQWGSSDTLALMWVNASGS